MDIGNDDGTINTKTRDNIEKFFSTLIGPETEALTLYINTRH